MGSRIASILYLSIIKDSFNELLPVIMAGSFASLVNNVVCSTSNGLAGVSGFGFLADFSPIFSAINYATMNVLSLYLVFLIGSLLGEYRGASKLTSGMAALLSFIVLVPTSTTVTAKVSEETVNVANVLVAKSFRSPFRLWLTHIYLPQEV